MRPEQIFKDKTLKPKQRAEFVSKLILDEKTTADEFILFAAGAKDPVKALLINTEDVGTVVRWSAAYGLSQILKLKTTFNGQLVPAVESIVGKEEKQYKKMYLDVLKRIQ